MVKQGSGIKYAASTTGLTHVGHCWKSSNSPFRKLVMHIHFLMSYGREPTPYL